MKTGIQINRVHHVSIICSDIEKSKHFYTEVLGFSVVQEIYRSDRDSYKVDMSLNGQYILELFSFPGAPPRPSYPEALGLRHLAFEVNDVEAAISWLRTHGHSVENIRKDEHTQKLFTFMADPDGLPIELYEK